MKLTIIIVNYNVQHFLANCLRSVQNALKGIQAEIYVVDNHSTDGSDEMMRSHFPNVNYLYNLENLGFARANNQAIRLAQGEYVLLLNPDTIVPPTVLRNVIHFLDTNPQAGAAGVAMVNGEGTYLKESKRGFPTPWVSFCKLSGLIKLFPKHPWFAEYYVGYLSPDAIHEIPILAGAFMMIRRPLLLEVGMLDERYFMFGEDIDLSYSLLRTGHKNYYLPYTITHFKGESTKQVTNLYRRVFYEAMHLFYQKYYPRQAACWGGILRILLRIIRLFSHR